MNRSLVTHGVCLLLGSVATLALVLWLQRDMEYATAQGGGAGTASGNGDVNASGTIDISDAVYLLASLFLGGPPPVAIECPPIGLQATGQTKCYDNAGNEIPCDSADFPGQDGFYQAGCPIQGRFMDNGDGTVTDNCTGLEWQKNTADIDGDGVIVSFPSEWPEDAVTWQNALKYCEGLNFAGHDDWRLPNVRELQSIVDCGRWDTAIDGVFGAVSNDYWTSCSDVSRPYIGWTVHFYGGFIDDVQCDKSKVLYVRAVRGGL